MKAVDVYQHTRDGMTLGPCHVGSHVPDGLAAPEGFQCDAHSQNTDQRCPKFAAVVLLVDIPGVMPIYLCGTHYDRHRRGKPVPLDA